MLGKLRGSLLAPTFHRDETYALEPRVSGCRSGAIRALRSGLAFQSQLGDDSDWLRCEVHFLECPDASIEELYHFAPAETAGGWRKAAQNPVLGGKLGTCFDVSLLKEGDLFRMWFSWRPRASVALVESKDGLAWSEPVIVLGPNNETDWESDINRPVVLKKDKQYHMWYTGSGERTFMDWPCDEPRRQGLETDGAQACPVAAGKVGEGRCHVPARAMGRTDNEISHVVFRRRAVRARCHRPRDQSRRQRLGKVQRQSDLSSRSQDRLGERSRDGCSSDPPRRLVRDVLHRLPGSGSCPDRSGAVSKDGLTNWQRHPANPIIRPGQDRWDHDAVYKPFAIYDGTRWLLWYNGRNGGTEQIGLAVHEGEDLGF